MRTPKFLLKINENDICYFQSSLNYTVLFLENGTKIISGYNIKVYEQLYQDHNFIKINRSNLVNITFIQKTILQKNACTILLYNGDKMPVSRRYLRKLKVIYPTLFYSFLN